MVKIILTSGMPFTPDKCVLCTSKLPPHPAQIAVERADGTTCHDVCPKCEAGIRKLARLTGPYAVSIEIPDDTPEEGSIVQTEMLFEDVSDPPTPAPAVVERIRTIAQEVRHASTPAADEPNDDFHYPDPPTEFHSHPRRRGRLSAISTTEEHV